MRTMRTTGCWLLSLVAVAAFAVPVPGWRDPAVEARIRDGIERHRKGDATLVVVDAAGRPVAGAQIEVAQTGHEFLFGCNAFVLGQLATPELNARYEAAFTQLFNFATVPFYWEGTEPARGELRYEEPARDIWRRPPPDRFLPWAEKNNLTLKGHPLLWHAYNPAWVPRDPEELRALYRKRFREIAGRFGTRIPIWDVVNESRVCPTNHPFFRRDGDYVKWAFAEAAPLFPADRTLMINEVTTFNFPPAEKNAYFEQVKALLAQGAAVRGIGFQYHFFRRAALDGYLNGPNHDATRLLDLYEKFAGFDRPLYITEITIPSAGEGGETLQAEVVRDLYRLWFSAPRMAGITWWNLGDGTAVKGENEAQGGLMDDNLQPKAAYRALDQLINTEWKTRTRVETDARGRATFRGFYGPYRLSIAGVATSQTFTVRHSSTSPTPHRLVVGASAR